jgi:hypothetical protein
VRFLRLPLCFMARSHHSSCLITLIIFVKNAHFKALHFTVFFFPVLLKPKCFSRHPVLKYPQYVPMPWSDRLKWYVRTKNQKIIVLYIYLFVCFRTRDGNIKYSELSCGSFFVSVLLICRYQMFELRYISKVPLVMLIV